MTALRPVTMTAPKGYVPEVINANYFGRPALRLT